MLILTPRPVCMCMCKKARRGDCTSSTLSTYSIEVGFLLVVSSTSLESWQSLGSSLLYHFWGGDYKYAQGLLHGCFDLSPSSHDFAECAHHSCSPSFFNQLHFYAIVHATLNVNSEIFSSVSFVSSFLKMTHNVKLWLNKVVMVFSCLLYYRNMFLTLMIWRKRVTPLRLSLKEKERH